MEAVIGHDEIKDRFRTAIRRDRLPSTFLFLGPEGVGKQTFAMALAKSLLCQGDLEDPLEACSECESCKLFDAGISEESKRVKDVDLDLNQHPDFKYVKRRENRNSLLIEQFIGKDDRRNKEGLVHDISRSPSLGKRKIAIIDDGDSLNHECANCLLKTLEEPPARAVIIIIGKIEQGQLPTIRSRSQLVHFKALSIDEVKLVLQRIPGESLLAPIDEIATRSNGSLTILQQYQSRDLVEFRESFFNQLASRDITAGGFVKKLSDCVDQAGKENPVRRQRARQLVDFAIEFYRSVGLRLVGSEIDMGGDRLLMSAVEKVVADWDTDIDMVADCIDRCLDVHRHLNANANLSNLIECWLSDLGKLSRGEIGYHEIKQVLAG